jgi:hypothetical protein
VNEQLAGRDDNSPSRLATPDFLNATFFSFFPSPLSCASTAQLRNGFDIDISWPLPSLISSLLAQHTTDSHGDVQSIVTLYISRKSTGLFSGAEETQEMGHNQPNSRSV